MPGDDRTVGIGKDRIGEPELADRGRDLVQLPLRMGPGVARIGDHGADRPVDDFKWGSREKTFGH